MVPDIVHPRGAGGLGGSTAGVTGGGALGATGPLLPSLHAVSSSARSMETGTRDPNKLIYIILMHEPARCLQVFPLRALFPVVQQRHEALGHIFVCQTGNVEP